MGLKKIAQFLYDQGHSSAYLIFARELLAASCRSESTEEWCRPLFKREHDQIHDGSGSQIKKAVTTEYPLGRSKEERRYRSWCLKHRLFLNPLNDLLGNSVAARDIFGVPTITTKEAEMPPLFRRYNLMKQELVGARYKLFEAMHFEKIHFSDRDVLLYNTLDYPSHSYSSELMKSAYRSAYSILDKIAFMLRDYFDLKIKEKRVSFRSVWYVDGAKEKGLNPILVASENVPLRGLFWLGKDLFEDKPEFRDAIEPGANALHELRNHIEHKFLSVHEYLHSDDLSVESESGTLKISLKEFEKKTFKVLGLARSALMYLSLAIYIDQQKATATSESGLSADMLVDVIDDSWKRRF